MTATENKTGDLIAQQLSSAAKVLGCKFTIKGEPITADAVFAKNGLLPAIMRRADQLSSFCMSYGLGVTFEKADAATLGVSVEFDQVTPNSLRLLCALDVLIEMMQMAPTQDVTPLDELMLD